MTTGPAYFDAFRNINIQPDNVNITADAVNDTLTLVAGSGISLVASSTNDQLTIVNTGSSSSAGLNDVLTVSNTSALSMSVGGVTTSSLSLTATKIALGASAGITSQGAAAVAIGRYAGNDTQGDDAVAIGRYSGNYSQSGDAVAVGAGSGQMFQSMGAVAIGKNAGYSTQGFFSVAIGYAAGQNSQPSNSIVINASGSGLDGTQSGFYVNPIRNVDNSGYQLAYDYASKEIIYDLGEWTGFVPTWSASTTSPSIGNGLIEARYKQVGKTVHVWMMVTMGSTTTFGTGEYKMSLPVNGRALSSVVLNLVMRKDGVRLYNSLAHNGYTTSGSWDNANVTLFWDTDVVTHNTPFTWASGDWFIISGTYEAA